MDLKILMKCAKMREYIEKRKFIEFVDKKYFCHPTSRYLLEVLEVKCLCLEEIRTPADTIFGYIILYLLISCKSKNDFHNFEVHLQSLAFANGIDVWLPWRQPFKGSWATGISQFWQQTFIPFIYGKAKVKLISSLITSVISFRYIFTVNSPQM